VKIFGKQTESIVALAARLPDVEVGVRWGGPNVPGALNGGRLLDGWEQLEALHAAGVPHPAYSNELQDALDTVRAGGVVMGRRTDHTQGKDIRFSDRPRVRGQRKWQNSDYFVEWEQSIREWRFHIFRGESIGRGLKVCGDLGLTGWGARIRSRRLGWTLDHKPKPDKALREAAKAAVAAVGYDFGAVDLLELTDGMPCVLEVNSRPALRDEYTLSCYAEAIRKYADSI